MQRTSAEPLLHLSADGGVRPSPKQELLLRAALLETAEASNAWLQWIAAEDIDHLDLGSFRLLPLLYRNLRDHGIDHPLMSRLKGIYRRTWYENQMLFSRSLPAVRALQDRGIRTAILKGAGLLPLFYRDFGVRPMSDFDVLVPEEHAEAALRHLLEEGWQPKEKCYSEINPILFASIHSMNLKHDKFGQIDLHWRLLRLRSRGEAQEHWRHTIPWTTEGVVAETLDPALQLFCVCVHGAHWHHISPIRWITDAAAVLNAGIEPDWKSLVRFATGYEATLPLRDTLGYLRTEFGMKIPEAIIEELRAAPASRYGRTVYRHFMKPHRSAWASIRMICHEYRQNMRGYPGQFSPFSFRQFAKYRWGLPSITAGIAHALRRTFRSTPVSTAVHVAPNTTGSRADAGTIAYLEK